MLTEEMRNYVIDKVTGDKAVRLGLKEILLKGLEFKPEEVLESKLYVKDDLIWLKVRFMNDAHLYQKSRFSYEPDTLYDEIQPLLNKADPRLMQKALSEAYKNLHEALDDSYDHVCCNRCDYIHNKLQAVNNQLWAIGRYLGLRPNEEPPKM